MHAAFARSLGLSESLLKTDQFYGELMSFLRDDFLGWIDELYRNKPQFAGFSLKEDFRKMITDQEYKIDVQHFIDGLSRFERKYESITSHKERFMRIIYETINEIVFERVRTLPTGDTL